MILDVTKEKAKQVLLTRYKELGQTNFDAEDWRGRLRYDVRKIIQDDNDFDYQISNISFGSRGASALPGVENIAKQRGIRNAKQIIKHILEAIETYGLEPQPDVKSKVPDYKKLYDEKVQELNILKSKPDVKRPVQVGGIDLDAIVADNALRKAKSEKAEINRLLKQVEERNATIGDLNKAIAQLKEDTVQWENITIHKIKKHLPIQHYLTIIGIMVSALIGAFSAGAGFRGWLGFSDSDRISTPLPDEYTKLYLKADSLQNVADSISANYDSLQLKIHKSQMNTLPFDRKDFVYDSLNRKKP